MLPLPEMSVGGGCVDFQAKGLQLFSFYVDVLLCLFGNMLPSVKAQWSKQGSQGSKRAS